jgi:hypothetical protein
LCSSALVTQRNRLRREGYAFAPEKQRGPQPPRFRMVRRDAVVDGWMDGSAPESSKVTSPLTLVIRIEAIDTAAVAVADSVFQMHL